MGWGLHKPLYREVVECLPYLSSFRTFYAYFTIQFIVQRFKKLRLYYKCCFDRIVDVGDYIHDCYKINVLMIISRFNVVINSILMTRKMLHSNKTRWSWEWLWEACKKESRISCYDSRNNSYWFSMILFKKRIIYGMKYYNEFFIECCLFICYLFACDGKMAFKFNYLCNHTLLCKVKD